MTATGLLEPLLESQELLNEATRAEKPEAPEEPAQQPATGPGELQQRSRRRIP